MNTLTLYYRFYILHAKAIQAHSFALVREWSAAAIETIPGKRRASLTEPHSRSYCFHPAETRTIVGFTVGAWQFMSVL